MNKKVMIKKTKKFRRRFNPRLIKLHANYTTQEIANLLHVHINTVNGWYGKGLKTIDIQKPFMVFGQDLIDFLTRRNNQMKKKCGPDEFFCCKCKEPRKAWEGLVDIKVLNPIKMMLMGLCDTCNTRMNRLVAAKKIDTYRKMFVVREIQEEPLIGCGATSVTTNEKGV